MDVEIRHTPAATIASCKLKKGDAFRAEHGALIGFQGSLRIETSTYQKKGGGFVAGLKRVLSGESFFMNRFESTSETSEVWLSTPLPGDIFVHELKGDKLVVASGGFLACEEDIHIDFEWQGMKSILSGEGLFWIKAEGQGKVIVNSFGFIHAVDVEDEYIVDTGHIVAFEDTLKFTISKASESWLGAYLSGEGFVCRFAGKGRVWMQSHSPSAFGEALSDDLRPKKE